LKKLLKSFTEGYLFTRYYMHHEMNLNYVLSYLMSAST
jgi:hypothetical protein